MQLFSVANELNLQVIFQLDKEGKQNAQCISTTLGDAQLWYLGFIFKENRYNRIPNTELFIHSSNPWTFKVHDLTVLSRTNTTAKTLLSIDIAKQHAKYEEHKNSTKKHKPLNKPFKIITIGKEHLHPIRDKYTDMINHWIPDIIQYLQDTYGQLGDQELSDLEDELKICLPTNYISRYDLQ